MTSFASNWAKAYRISQECAQLERLSDHQLRDIGVPRASIRKVVSRAVTGQ